MSELKSRPLMTCQTGTDESYLVGTKKQLLSFANTIIAAVESAKPGTFWGEDALVHHFYHGILDDKGEVGIDEVVVVDTDEQKDAIFYKIEH